jgi:hypothetical protein
MQKLDCHAETGSQHVRHDFGNSRLAGLACPGEAQQNFMVVHRQERFRIMLEVAVEIVGEPERVQPWPTEPDLSTIAALPGSG